MLLMDGGMMPELNWINTIIQHDVMKPWPLPDGCVQAVITSPPYWGLRDYSIEGQLGLEKTPEEYIEKMVAVFRECRRVLRDDGTVWLNLGDSYAGSWGNSGSREGGQRSKTEFKYQRPAYEDHDERPPNSFALPGLKPKDLCGIPWRVALALQGFAVIPFKSLSQWADWLAEAIALEDWEIVQMVQQRIRLHTFLEALKDAGFYLRSDIIWSKPNPMPESVTDRPTKAHEYLFLLTKKAKYYYDADAVREPHSNNIDTIKRYEYKKSKGSGRTDGISCPTDLYDEYFIQNDNKRNRRTVWEIPTQPYSEAHFATFPEKLVEPCILAGTSEKGCCPDCGMPWTRVVGNTDEYESAMKKGGWQKEGYDGLKQGHYKDAPTLTKQTKTLGWKPQCECNKEPVPCIVLDPFMGSGTVAKVALRANRRFVGLELSQKYIDMAYKRIESLLVQRKLI